MRTLAGTQTRTIKSDTYAKQPRQSFIHSICENARKSKIFQVIAYDLYLFIFPDFLFIYFFVYSRLLCRGPWEDVLDQVINQLRGYD